MADRSLVIGVGFQKTGTSTLRESLKILGYTVKDATARALIPILKKDWNKIEHILRKYDAIQDTPWYYIYKDLDRLYPGSKFVLTIRDEEKWYRSVKRHIGDLRSAHHECTILQPHEDQRTRMHNPYCGDEFKSSCYKAC